MGLVKLLLKVILIPIVVLVVIAVAIVLLIKMRRDRKKKERELENSFQPPPVQQWTVSGKIYIMVGRSISITFQGTLRELFPSKICPLMKIDD
ncbi:hypothetical protein PENPOL_c001G04595 [Penicillium polonicum]|uniref:Uncharacterized protein n=1 Tax=Penicillium polonicum TaxID=60169 RepID=A0A1V6P595_PENPO|nr:hypothetical protein PENPOL_c001G04595 [Penicillium polonicum]